MMGVSVMNLLKPLGRLWISLGTAGARSWCAALSCADTLGIPEASLTVPAVGMRIAEIG